MGDAVVGEGVRQRLDHSVLADQITEVTGAVLARKDLVDGFAHEGSLAAVSNGLRLVPATGDVQQGVACRSLTSRPEVDESL